MKIAHLTTVDISLRYLLFPQLEAIRDEGWEVVGISAPGPWVAELESAGMRHIPLQSSTRGMDPLADLKAAAELWRVLRRERFDILHTHNPKPGLYGRVLGRIARVPGVLNTVHGLYATPDDRFAKRAVVYTLEAIASRFSDAELIQSSEDVELFKRLRLAPRPRIWHLGNGVDLERFDPQRLPDSVRNSVRAELGIAPDKIVVGLVGRLVAEKGYGELFEAARILDDDRYVFLCVGPSDPDKSDGLSEADIQRAEQDGIRFLGMRTDVDRLYTAMDIFTLPSYREGFPRAAMEAAAMALPVITTDARGCREVVAEGENGLLVPVADASALAAAIAKLGDNADLRNSMGEEGRRRAEKHFDERQVVKTVMETYRRLASEKDLLK